MVWSIVLHSYGRCKLVYLFLFIYLGFYVAFNIVQVISRRVVGRAEETSTNSSLGFCSAGRSLGFFLSKFVSDICNQTSNISDYGVEV